MEDRDREVRLSWEENQKLKVLQEVMGGSRRQASAARALGITDRWVRELLRRVGSKGAMGLVHGSRGRCALNRTPEAMKGKIVELYRDKYEDFNLTHYREMLAEREGIEPPCRETIRRILQEAGAWERRRVAPKHRLRRPRREYEGELVQMDASIHRWLGPEGPLWALVGAIDDATGKVPNAEFCEAETREAYFRVVRGMLERYGLPRAVYTDRDSVFVVNTAKDRERQEAEGVLPKTQFGRALRELSIEWIPAYSPQAKGRIERLWGTFQDRLFHELRLAGVKSLEEANEYLHRRFLGRFNRRFARAAAYDDPVWRPAPSRARLEGILCWKETRVLARDHTFQVQGEVWQVMPHPKLMALAGKVVEVRRTPRGTTQAWYGGLRLSIRPAPKTPPRASLRATPFGAPAPLAAAPGVSCRMRGKLHP